jgi:phytol kinase
MIRNDLLALVVTFITALLWLRLNDSAAHRGWIENKLSRKIIHIGTGPIFVICWLLFTSSPTARLLAALVPFLVGLGIIKDPAAVEAMSRSGDRREILRGPLFYGIIFVVLTIVYWYDSPTGLTALMLLCGGDGLADVLGRRFGRNKLPWAKTKSWAGSLGMFLGGWLLSLAVLAVYVWAGKFSPPYSAYILPVAIIAFIGTVVESLPIRDLDNVTVTIAAVIAGHLLF